MNFITDRALPVIIALLVAAALAWILSLQSSPSVLLAPPSSPEAAKSILSTEEHPSPIPLPLSLSRTNLVLDDALPPLPTTSLVKTSDLLHPDPGRSVGTPQTGHLADGVDLLAEPILSLRVLPATLRRGYTWGTAELVTLLHDTAKATTRTFPGVRLTVGNLSRRGGGDIPQSVSHNSGRDADIGFFAIDRDNHPQEAQHYIVFDKNGVAVSPKNLAGLIRFDVPRTWVVLRNLLTHPAVVVQWIFIATPLRNMLLDHALRIGEPELLRERARRVLVQPSDSSPHADHMHVRIACPPDDRPGCIDGAGRTALARVAQVDALLEMYRRGSPAEQRYARDLLSLSVDGRDLILPPVETNELDEAATDN